MNSTQQKTRRLRGNRAEPCPLRKRFEKLFAFLAVLAVALNFMVPVTHSLISNAQAGEYLEVCTNQGIKLIKVDLASEGSESEMGSACSACPDCPLCLVSGSTSSCALSSDAAAFTFASIEGETFGLHVPAGREDSLWCRPAARAPPAA